MALAYPALGFGSTGGSDFNTIFGGGFDGDANGFTSKLDV